jgi:hypothetical protein
VPVRSNAHRSATVNVRGGDGNTFRGPFAKSVSCSGVSTVMKVCSQAWAMLLPPLPLLAAPPLPSLTQVALLPGCVQITFCASSSAVLSHPLTYPFCLSIYAVSVLPFPFPLSLPLSFLPSPPFLSTYAEAVVVATNIPNRFIYIFDLTKLILFIIADLYIIIKETIK